MRLIHISAWIALLALVLTGCPKKSTESTSLTAPEEPAPQVDTLVDRWEQFDLSLYAGLRQAPAKGVSLRELALRHDVDRYTTVLTTWSPPSRAVLEIEDAAPVNRIRGAIGGWVLSDGPTDVEGVESVGPDALLHGEASRWFVGSVLLREWTDAPQAEDPFDLLLAEALRLPAPWSVCRPRTADQLEQEQAEAADPMTMAHVTDPIALHAVDGERGSRIGLKAVARGESEVVSGSGPFNWTIDHVEWASPLKPLDEYWPALGFIDCLEIGKVVNEERAKRPRRSFGPPE